MNRAQIIQWRRASHGPITDQWWEMDASSLERFAALVAAHEREECAKVCDGEFQSWIDKCSDGAVSVKTCSALIRARGNT